MTEIIKLQDPVIATISYLRSWFPDVRDSIPFGFEWDRPLVTVTDTGGTGERDIILDDVMLRLLVVDPDKATASDNARIIHGLLRAWCDGNDRVHWNGTVQRPTFDPDEETRTPAYSFTVRLIFRASTSAVSP